MILASTYNLSFASDLGQSSISTGRTDLPSKLQFRFHLFSYSTKMIASKAFFIVSFCLASTLASTPFRPCDNGEAVPLSLRVEGCTTEPCPFRRGTDIIAEWDFAVVADTDNLKPEVFVTAKGITVKYPFPHKDACKSITHGECPLDEGEEVTYNLRMPILSLYPKGSVALKFSLVDNSGKVHVCLKLNAKIVDK